MRSKLKYLILIIILVALISTIICLNNNNTDKEIKPTNIQIDNTNNSININTLDYNNYITSESENNKDYVKYFSSGMNIDDLKEILNRKENYIDKTGTYEKVNYNFEKHLKYSEFDNIFYKLNNSEIVNLEIIGTSVDNRNLYSIEIGNGTKEIILEGNIHAAEISPLLFLTKFSIDLVNEYEENDEETKTLLNKVKFIIVPSANPDGYDYSVFGKNIINNKETYVYINDSDIDRLYYKANLNGVDLNRNFPSQTAGLYFKNEKLSTTVSKTKSTKMYEYFAGDTLGSEPETKALMYLMYKHYKEASSYISLHSAGRVIFDEQQYLSNIFNKETKQCSNIINKYTKYEQVGIDMDDVKRK